MAVIEHTNIKAFNIPGINHQTLCDVTQGCRSMEIWQQTVAPGAATPVHRHDCEEAIIVLSGSGKLIIADQEQNFGPNSTLYIPANAIHQLINSGDEEMHLIASLAMSPVQVFTADDQLIPLPWQG